MTPAGVISISIGRGAGSAIGLLGDRRLALLAAKGDPRAFAAIYERHHQDIFRYCRSVTGNSEDASDALQSTMAAVLRALPGERREVALRPWLFRIAHNESVSIIRRRASYVELTESMAPTAPGPHAVASIRERLSGLVSDLQALPERQRGALVMRELIGLEYREIAEALNVSGGAARQAVYEARLALSQSDEGREMACDAARRSISARRAGSSRPSHVRAPARMQPVHAVQRAAWGASLGPSRAPSPASGSRGRGDRRRAGGRRGAPRRGSLDRRSRQCELRRPHVLHDGRNVPGGRDVGRGQGSRGGGGRGCRRGRGHRGGREEGGCAAASRTDLGGGRRRFPAGSDARGSRR